MTPLLEIAERYGLVFIEDAAEAIGSEYRGKPCGGFGDMSCFSFFANKVLTTGEGGMVATASAELAEACRSFKNLSFPAGARVFLHERLAFNYRLSNVAAAIGLAQLERVSFYVERRRANALRYAERLRGVDGLILPVERPWAKNSYWMYAMRITDAFGETRDDAMTRMRAKGVETRPFFIPMHRQPALRRHGCACDGEWPVSDEIARTGLYLPSSSDLTDAEIDRVCDTLLEARRGR
jgi:perosamine synthetase